MKSIHTDLNTWNVIYTAPRAELKVAKRLSDMGYTVYCPTRKEVRQWSDRKKKLTIPVLPSMVLINIDHRIRNQVFDIPGTIRYMFWLGKIAKVTDKEITLLRDSLDQKDIVQHEIHHLQPGTTINVSAIGDKKGVVKKSSSKKVWVELKELNCIVTLNVA